MPLNPAIPRERVAPLPITAILRPLALAAAAAVGILVLLPAALHAVALRALAGA